MMLGCRPSPLDRRTLRLERFVRADLTLDVKARVDWTERPAFQRIGMFCNDSLGCCTVTQLAHLLEVRTAADAGVELDVRDAAIRHAYAVIGGGRDEGATVLAALKYARRVGIDGCRLEAFAHINLIDMRLLRWSIDVFGGVSMAVDLPLAAQGQFQRKEDWHVPAGGARGSGAPGSWGGHALAAVGYDELGVIVHSWAQRRRMRWDFVHAYAFEAWASLDRRWLGPDMRAPSGFDLAGLALELARVTTK